MLPSYFDYIFVDLRQKVCLRPELSPKFLSTLGPNPTRKAPLDLQLWLDYQPAQQYLYYAFFFKSRFFATSEIAKTSAWNTAL